MPFTLASKSLASGGNNYYAEDYLLMIDTHVPWLINHPTTVQSYVSPGDAYKYNGDLTGLLLMLGLPNNRHYAIMRMNGMRSPQDYRSNLNVLSVPSESVMRNLDQIFFSTTVPFGT